MTAPALGRPTFAPLGARPAAPVPTNAPIDFRALGAALGSRELLQRGLGMAISLNSGGRDWAPQNEAEAKQHEDEQRRWSQAMQRMAAQFREREAQQARAQAFTHGEHVGGQQAAAARVDARSREAETLARLRAANRSPAAVRDDAARAEEQRFAAAKAELGKTTYRPDEGPDVEAAQKVVDAGLNPDPNLRSKDFNARERATATLAESKAREARLAADAAARAGRAPKDALTPAQKAWAEAAKAVEKATSTPGTPERDAMLKQEGGLSDDQKRAMILKKFQEKYPGLTPPEGATSSGAPAPAPAPPAGATAAPGSPATPPDSPGILERIFGHTKTPAEIEAEKRANDGDDEQRDEAGPGNPVPQDPQSAVPPGKGGAGGGGPPGGSMVASIPPPAQGRPAPASAPPDDSPRHNDDRFFTMPPEYGGAAVNPFVPSLPPAFEDDPSAAPRAAIGGDTDPGYDGLAAIDPAFAAHMQAWDLARDRQANPSGDARPIPRPDMEPDPVTRMRMLTDQNMRDAAQRARNAGRGPSSVPLYDASNPRERLIFDAQGEEDRATAAPPTAEEAGRDSAALKTWTAGNQPGDTYAQRHARALALYAQTDGASQPVGGEMLARADGRGVVQPGASSYGPDKIAASRGTPFAYLQPGVDTNGQWQPGQLSTAATGRDPNREVDAHGTTIGLLAGKTPEQRGQALAEMRANPEKFRAMGVEPNEVFRQIGEPPLNEDETPEARGATVVEAPSFS